MASPGSRGLRWLRAAAAAAALVFVSGLARAREDGLQVLGGRLPELCPAARAGGACPGCGFTRAGVCLFQGDPAAAWAWHPAAFGLLFLLLSLAAAPEGSWGPRLRRLAALWIAGAALLRWGGWI